MDATRNLGKLNFGSGGRDKNDTTRGQEGRRSREFIGREIAAGNERERYRIIKRV